MQDTFRLSQSFLIIFATLTLAVSCAEPTPESNTDAPTESKLAYVDPPSTTSDNEIWCLPGCNLVNDIEDKPVIPEWCVAWGPRMQVPCGDEDICDFESGSNSLSGQYACTKIDLSKLRHGVGAYAPKKVGKQNAPLLVNCDGGCLLPKRDFGCAKPAGTAPFLPWCGNVENGCSSGQSEYEIRVGASRIPRPGKSRDIQPYCTAFSYNPETAGD